MLSFKWFIGTLGNIAKKLAIIAATKNYSCKMHRHQYRYRLFTSIFMADATVPKFHSLLLIFRKSIASESMRDVRSLP